LRIIVDYGICSRILRRHKDKKDAIIHDFIVASPLKKTYNSEAMEEKKNLSRIMRTVVWKYS
jgi:hypothetical protein